MFRDMKLEGFCSPSAKIGTKNIMEPRQDSESPLLPSLDDAKSSLIVHIELISTNHPATMGSRDTFGPA